MNVLQYVLRKMVADANGVNILPFYGDSLEFRGYLCGALLVRFSDNDAYCKKWIDRIYLCELETGTMLL